MGLKFNVNKYKVVNREVRIKSGTVGKRGTATAKHPHPRRRRLHRDYKTVSKKTLSAENREFLHLLTRANR